ncbi:26S proteasome non-ATPase regulatory subunit 4 [Artemisia annua]|uniref:26S proteasome non-ATPase regulatory subunit 4 n=1 Tax=Artemisia annua TaxID=35608 RepID=A0A2U1P1A0_ARTAN|nr:26S proteasome non-ATPase regulatory subunit 4 [Artemisia annua]
MVNEVTMICMDTSSWMKYSKSYEFLLQIDAIEVYCEKYLQSHPENYVGVLAMGGKNNRSAIDDRVFSSYQTYVVVEPTKDLSLIMSRVRGFVNVGGDTLLVTALMTGLFHLNKKHENLLKRLVVFAGGPLGDTDNQYTKLGTKLKERSVAVDVVNFGDQQAGYKKHQLLVLLAAVNNNDNTRMLDLCGHHLNGSSITPLVVGQGERCLYAVYLLQGEDLQKAKNQCDKVHGYTNAAIGYIFRKMIRVRDEQRKRHTVGDRRKLEREWDIGKDIPFDDDAGKERYWDQGDRYGRKSDYRVRDKGREICGVGDRRKLKRDDDAGKEIYWDRGDSLHDLKPDGGNDDTRNRKRERDYRGHDEGRERYRNRGDRYGRKRDYRGHDEGRERYRVGDGRIQAR